ncbi:MAG: hypothetical protein ISS15_08120 [Alphaproteobacteria bacterium]|nr:hypothetical protein [Alphaproteobacteria bacterium]MBL6936837.1 hypothetical protein [Alphaproteobacteria bacterium]MBL7097606.1 hypothetical protein [Alphaproteobacteria bacterium]
MAFLLAQSAQADDLPDGRDKTAFTVVGRFYGNWSEADALPTSLSISRHGQRYAVEIETAAPGNRWDMATVTGHGSIDHIVFNVPRRLTAHGQVDLIASKDGHLHGRWTHVQDGRTVTDAVWFRRGTYNYGDAIMVTTKP